MSCARSRLSVAALATMLAVLSAVQAPAAEKTAKQIPAFPGAEGFGAYARGGRGGRVIEVTNLNTSGPGSLQAACSAEGPRIVVFRVSGIIEGGLGIAKPFLTIAGQTAPGDGICLRNGTLTVAAHDVIVRHLRVRPGDHPFGRGPSNRDCLDVSGDRTRDVIIDHCSFSWGIDENVSTWYGPRNVTIQWCISSESLLDSLHPKGPHGMGMLLGNRDNTVTVHHCLLAHNSGRNPLLASRGKTASIFDFRNNVIYNHGKWSCTHFGSASRLGVINFVGNTIKMGANGMPSRPRGLGITVKRGQKAYVRDNVWPGRPAGDVDDWLVVGGCLGPKRKPVSEAGRLREPTAAPRVTTEPATRAYESVLSFAGCSRPVRDVVDARIMQEVRARTGHIIDSQEDVGGYPDYASATPPADTDHDAMPDSWEKRHGFNPNDASDGPKDRDGDGYTNVEEFLNETDPTKPDSGAAIAQRPVQVQAGNDRIRGQGARRIGEERLAKLKTVSATPESREALLKKVRESDKEAADFLGIKFVRIPRTGKSGGEFMLRKVKMVLSKPFELSACEITQKQWETVMGTRPWSGQIGGKDDPEFPASYVSYLDCQEFIARLNASGGRKYRLPTLCEWIFAARAGTDSHFGFGTDKAKVPEYAWCSMKYRGPDGRFVRRSCTAPQAVGRLKANPWGLHDIAGNVHEWCHDWFGFDYHYRSLLKPGPPRIDPMGPKTGEYHLLCGGHFRYRRGDILRYRRSNHRPHYRGVGVGFRLRRSLAE